MAEDTRPPTSYIAFKTLQNLLDKLAPEPPPRIDKSVLSYLSGGYQMQVLAALKAIGLIQQDGTPTEFLNRLVVTPGTRRQTVKELWQMAYADVLSRADIERATAGQLDEAFREVYGLEGETRRKAMTFFIHGAQFAEMNVSALITAKFKRSNATATRRPRKKPESTNGASGASAPPPPPDSHTPLGPAVTVHPMLVGSIQWLSENGPQWTDVQAKMWCDNFVTSVKLVYPAKRWKPSIAAPTQEWAEDEGEEPELGIDDFGQPA